MNLVADMVDHGAPVNARTFATGETALHLVRGASNSHYADGTPIYDYLQFFF